MARPSSTSLLGGYANMTPDRPASTSLLGAFADMAVGYNSTNSNNNPNWNGQTVTREQHLNNTLTSYNRRAENLLSRLAHIRNPRRRARVQARIDALNDKIENTQNQLDDLQGNQHSQTNTSLSPSNGNAVLSDMGDSLAPPTSLTYDPFSADDYAYQRTDTSYGSTEVINNSANLNNPNGVPYAGETGYIGGGVAGLYPWTDSFAGRTYKVGADEIDQRYRDERKDRESEKAGKPASWFGEDLLDATEGMDIGDIDHLFEDGFDFPIVFNPPTEDDDDSDGDDDDEDLLDAVDELDGKDDDNFDDEGNLIIDDGGDINPAPDMPPKPPSPDPAPDPPEPGPTPDPTPDPLTEFDGDGMDQDSLLADLYAKYGGLLGESGRRGSQAKDNIYEAGDPLIQGFYGSENYQKLKDDPTLITDADMQQALSDAGIDWEAFASGTEDSQGNRTYKDINMDALEEYMSQRLNPLKGVGSGNPEPEPINPYVIPSLSNSILNMVSPGEAEPENPSLDKQLYNPESIMENDPNKDKKSKTPFSFVYSTMKNV